MNRWKTTLVHHWLAKLVSLAVATLLWLAIRHAMLPPAPSPAAGAGVTTQFR